MARSTEKADAAVRRLAQRYTEVGVESKIVAAAMAGASDNDLRLFANIGSGGAAFAKVGEQGSAAFRAIGAASETELQKTQARILQIAEKVRQVRDQAAALTQTAVSQRESGTLTDDSLKIRLAGIRAVQKAELERIATAARADAESQRAAAADVAATNQRIAAFEKLRTTVAQLKFKDDSKAQAEQAAAAKSLADSEAASAEKRVVAFQKLRDTVAQLNFKQQQEQAAALKATADADIAANERRKASTQALIDKLNGVPEAYRKQIAALKESLKAGDITPSQFLASARQATAQRPDIQKATKDAEASAAAQIVAEKRVAAEAKATADARVESARRIIDAQKGLLPGYREELQQLRILRDEGKLTQEQFRKAGADLVTRQPIVNVDPALIARIRQATAGMSGFGAAAGAAAAKTKLTNYEIQTLNFTISDVIASLASGISPTTILLQQGGQVRDVFGGFGPLFEKLKSVFTVTRVAIGGTVAALGALAFAFFEGQKASKEFADSIILSGNFAGQTEGSFNSLAKNIAASGQISISSAREFTQALISTGEVGPKNLALASEAAARFGTATGKSAKDVAEQFSALNRDVTAGTTKLNQSLNFVTAAQFLHIRTLQNQGKEVEAQGIVYELLNDRLKRLEPNLSTLDKLLRDVKGTWASFWDAAFDVGRATTIDDKLADVEKRLAAARGEVSAQAGVKFGAFTTPARAAGTESKPSENPPVQFGAFTFKDNRLASLEAEKAAALEVKRLQDRSAATIAASAAVNKLAIADRQQVEALLESGKSADSYVLALKKLEAQLKSNKEAGTPFTPEQEKIARDVIKKKFTATPDRSGESEAEALRKAQLAADLEFVKQQFTREQDALRFNQQELQAIYQAGTVSLKAFFDAKEALIRDGVQGELNALTDEQARLEVELAKPLKESTKVDLQKRLDASVESSERLQRRADEAAILGSLERAAAQKVLTDRVVDFRANLLQLAGDEEGAAKLRTDQAIAAAQAFAKATASQGQSTVGADEVARFAALTLASNRFAEAQRQVGLETSRAQRAEQLFLLAAEKGGATLAQTEQGLTAIRLKSLEVLRERLAVQQANAGDDPAKLEAVAQLAAQIEIEADRADASLNRLRDSVKAFADSVAENIGNALTDFKGVKPFLESIQKDLLRETTKLLVTEPLKVEFRAVFKGLSEGDGALSGLFKNLLGGGSGSGVAGATATQTAAVTASATAMTTLTAAATAAAAALGAVSATSGISGLIGGGGGFGSGFNFGNQDLGQYFHEGGIVGSGGAMRPVPRGTWANAVRYRTGGIAGLKPDEVPAILHRREEVLRRDDPRHRWNGGGASGGGSPVVVNVNQSFAANTDRRTVAQAASDAGMQVRRSMARHT